MRYKIFWLLLSMLAGYSSENYAQYENVWAFGKRCGLNFNNGAPQPFLTNMGVYPGTAYSAFGEGSASICDSKGSLLFYTEGFYVWDRNGNVMPNGRDLIPLNGLNITHTPSSSTSQGAVIVPVPENQDKYYIFSLTAREHWQQRAGDLYYSIVDMSLNGGLGDVVSDKKAIFVDSFLSERMTATRGNRCNIWLLAGGISSTSSNFKAYEITASGVNTNAVVSGTGLGSAAAPIGTFTVSPDGRKVIATQSGIWGGVQGAALFDFDRNTGLFSNKIQLLSCCGGYGACFSPDNTKAYVSSMNGNIHQYDLSFSDPADIVASDVTVGSVGLSHLKLAPNGKIYFLNGNQIGAINTPNNTGQACGYIPNAVQMLPDQDMHAGLPNVIAVIPYNTDRSVQKAEGACWANVNRLTLQAKNAGEGWDYIWQDSVTGPARMVDKPGTYYISYRTPPCNSHTDTFQVIFPNGVLPDIHIQKSCNGADNGKAWAATYPADTVSYHYIWTNSTGDTLSITDTLTEVPSGTYNLQVRTFHCDTNISFVLPEEHLKASFTADSIICQGTALKFVNTSNEVFSEFQWRFGAQHMSSLRDPEHIFEHAGSYQVTLTAIEGFCLDSVTQTIIVDSMLTSNFWVQPDSICAGESITFRPVADSSVLNLHWNFGDGIEMESENVEKLQHAFAHAGSMPVTLTIRFRACPDTSFTDKVYVADLPGVDLGQDTLLCIGNNPIILKNLKKMTEDHYYLWNTGDTTEALKVIHPGHYSLKVTSQLSGCSNTETVEIIKYCYTNVPNVFTPNGDGINDHFFPRQRLSSGIAKLHFQVWNRWGQLLFETRSIDGRGWDGRWNGQEQPTGSYVYQVKVSYGNSKEELLSGNVTLIR